MQFLLKNVRTLLCQISSSNRRDFHIDWFYQNLAHAAVSDSTDSPHVSRFFLRALSTFNQIDIKN